ncbi:MAG TPA: hypothetical protein PLS20_07825 [Ruminococcus flavefaciens]|nr:hypothetical protein [Ruminococcus flavefaciens]
MNADTVLREQIRQRDKAIRDYNNDMAVARSEGEEKGMLDTLAGLVKNGLLTVAQAAETAHMSISEFEERTGLKA